MRSWPEIVENRVRGSRLSWKPRWLLLGLTKGQPRTRIRARAMLRLAGPEAQHQLEVQWPQEILEPDLEDLTQARLPVRMEASGPHLYREVRASVDPAPAGAVTGPPLRPVRILPG